MISTDSLARYARLARDAHHGNDREWELSEAVHALLGEVRRLHRRRDRLRQRIESWIRHGEAVPPDVTTYDRETVHIELRAMLEEDSRG